MPVHESMDVDTLATMTEGYSGAEIEALCRETALFALRKNLETKILTQDDFVRVIRTKASGSVATAS